MKIEARFSEDKLLADEIHRFWAPDTVGIKEIENSVVENIMANIHFEKGPCTVYSVQIPGFTRELQIKLE